jgi:hypothetical protein
MHVVDGVADPRLGLTLVYHLRLVAPEQLATTCQNATRYFKEELATKVFRWKTFVRYFSLVSGVESGVAPTTLTHYHL